MSGTAKLKKEKKLQQMKTWLNSSFKQFERSSTILEKQNAVCQPQNLYTNISAKALNFKIPNFNNIYKSQTQSIFFNQ